MENEKKKKLEVGFAKATTLISVGDAYTLNAIRIRRRLLD